MDLDQDLIIERIVHDFVSGFDSNKLGWYDDVLALRGGRLRFGGRPQSELLQICRSSHRERSNVIQKTFLHYQTSFSFLAHVSHPSKTLGTYVIFLFDLRLT